MKTITFIALLACAFPALADRVAMPAKTPASYTAECSSCHIAYQPSLLSAKDWRIIMDNLDKHFGTDTTVDRKIGQEIKAFLERHGGDPRHIGRTANPPRISESMHFVRHHHDVPSKFWRDPRVKSAANCEACHREAAKGIYSESDIAIPELRE